MKNRVSGQYFNISNVYDRMQEYYMDMWKKYTFSAKIFESVSQCRLQFKIQLEIRYYETEPKSKYALGFIYQNR